MDNNPAKASIKPSSFVERLAPELQLHILSCLPNVAEILKCRQVNSYMQRLIDLEENQAISSEVIISMKQRELERVVSLTSDYDIDAVDEDGNPCGFLNALVAFNKYRGLSRVFCFDYSMLHQMFAEHWWTKHPGSQGQDAESHGDAINSIFHAIVAIHSIHIMYHVNKNFKKGILETWTQSLSSPETMSVMRLSSTEHVNFIVERVAAGIFSDSAPFEEACEYAICCHYDAPKDWLQIKGSEKEMSLKLAKRRASKRLEAANEESNEDATAHARAADRVKSGQAKVNQSTNRFAIFEQDEEIEAEEDEADPQHGAQDSEDEYSIEVLLSDDAWFRQQEAKEWLTDQFGVIFGVPELPASLPFAYFAKTQWAYNSIADAAMGIKHLTPLEQAAVLEDVAIF
ncbi:uncharacterized protein MYCFIDRAFT_82096 [Pseudocercospora fijiensis CIRAD86]|uniref:F-box domain-containing protein n=1 Tax=Pseudocercospora fijiensis (strain CIRAD86) TaxID=383855 RepID=M3BA08_PSEFD|nr:uncharacterized protein MYCFIDRAFT_82096 [Pseudocercospora fijiensis CIRAD86]EME86162.1 hypothetical protein MYCFIDRAFT_82096 [Pseudocercospora fijiensis CIRAD86]